MALYTRNSEPRKATMIMALGTDQHVSNRGGNVRGDDARDGYNNVEIGDARTNVMKCRSFMVLILTRQARVG